MSSSGPNTRGILLHRRPFSDSKWLVDFLTDSHGRITGVQRTGSRTGFSVDLFVEFDIAWRGKSSLVNLTHCEEIERFELRGRLMYSGMYLNELVARNTRPYEPLSGLYLSYKKALRAISEGEVDLEPTLRIFERSLLKCIGYEFEFDRELQGGKPIEPQMSYEYLPDHGFRRLDEPSSSGIEGAVLLRIARNDYAEPKIRRVAKRLLRAALQHRMGDQPVLSRALFKPNRLDSNGSSEPNE